jgi:hypothetical protein
MTKLLTTRMWDYIKVTGLERVGERGSQRGLCGRNRGPGRRHTTGFGLARGLEPA